LRLQPNAPTSIRRAVHDLGVAEETFARLAYEETVRRLSGQMRVLEGLRTRAGTLFGAASLATSFLSAATARGAQAELGPAGWTAIVLYAFATVVAVWILMPASALNFTLQRRRVEELLNQGVPAEATPGGAYRQFALELESEFKSNWPKMRRRFRGLMLLGLLVGAELTLWTLEFVA
jgi:hypothetical protein